MKNRNAAFQTLASIICSICIYLYLFASCGYIGPCDFLSDRHFVGLTSPQTLNTFFGGSSKKSGHVSKPKKRHGPAASLEALGRVGVTAMRGRSDRAGRAGTPVQPVQRVRVVVPWGADPLRVPARVLAQVPNKNANNEMMISMSLGWWKMFFFVDSFFLMGGNLGGQFFGEERDWKWMEYGGIQVN